MKKIRNLDSIDKREVANSLKKLKRVFKGYAFAVFLIELIISIYNYILIIMWLDTSFYWTLFLHFPNLVRCILLLYIISFININVIKIMGVNKYYKIIRHFSYYNSLWLWILIGFLDNYVLRYTIAIIDISYFLLISHRVEYTQFLMYLILDILLIIEFRVSIDFIYYKGIWNNVEKNLLTKEISNSTNQLNIVSIV